MFDKQDCYCLICGRMLSLFFLCSMGAGVSLFWVFFVNCQDIINQCSQAWLFPIQITCSTNFAPFFFFSGVCIWPTLKGSCWSTGFFLLNYVIIIVQDWASRKISILPMRSSDGFVMEIFMWTLVIKWEVSSSYSSLCLNFPSRFWVQVQTAENPLDRCLLSVEQPWC